MKEGSLRCEHCGFTYGERNRCPHCGTIADVEPHSTLRYRCRVCGGPRVPLADTSLEPTRREWPLLEQAQRSKVRVSAWRVAASVVAAFGALSLFVTLLTLVFVTPGVLATAGLLGAVSVPFVLAALAWVRARRYARERDEALDEAWVSVASDVMEGKEEELHARELSRILRIDENKAEQLLARLNVETLVRARVTDAGELLYSGQKLRIGGEAPEEPAEEAEEEVPAAKAQHRADGD